MSIVEEVDEGWGSWSLTWKEDVPMSILAACDPYANPFSILRVYNTRVSEQKARNTTGIYAGVTMGSSNSSSGRELRGYGLAWLLGEPGSSVFGDRNEVGPFSTTAVTHSLATGSLSNWLSDILSITKSGLSTGYVSVSKTEKIPWSLKAYTPRTVLDTFLKANWGINWRVTPAMRVDVGLQSELHPSSLKRVIATKNGSRDIGATGMRADSVGLETEFDQWIRRAAVYNKATDTFFFANDPFYAWNPDGELMTYGHVSTIDDAAATSAYAIGLAAESVRENGLARSATLSVNEYNITDRVRLGGYIYVWDLEGGMWDLTNRMNYMGETIYPVKLDVKSITWPIMENMSVWVDRRHIDGDRGMVDITDHLVLSRSDTVSKLTVGRVPSKLGRTSRLKS